MASWTLIVTHETFFAENPDIEVLEAFVIDVNGVPRGKWIPRERALDVLTKGMAIPRSVYALDVWGPRRQCRRPCRRHRRSGRHLLSRARHAVTRHLAVAPQTAQVLLEMRNSDGSGFYADPRQVLAAVLERYKKLKLTPGRRDQNWNST